MTFWIWWSDCTHHNTKFELTRSNTTVCMLTSVNKHGLLWWLVGWFMVFNTTFYNISVVSWQSLLLVEETGVPRENRWPFASHWQTLSHNVVSKYTSPWMGFELTTLVVICTDCTGSCKSNYHTITTTTVPGLLWEHNI